MQKATTTGPTTRCIMCVFECLFGSSCFRFSWRRDAITVLYDVSKVETTESPFRCGTRQSQDSLSCFRVTFDGKESDAMRILCKSMTQKSAKVVSA